MHMLAVADLAADQFAGQRRFHGLLQITLERTRAVNRIVGRFGHKVAGLFAHVQLDLAFLKPLAQAFELEFHNAADLIPPERKEDHGFVHAVEEFRPEVAA